jgi:nitrite reductase/ring-hydroxylating ferredoxin subunit
VTTDAGPPDTVAAGTVRTDAVAHVDDIPPGWALRVRLAARFGSREVALARADGRVVAVAADCPHAGGPLGDTRLVDGCLRCPWHGSAFDAGTGAVVEGPARRPLAVFPLEVDEDGWIRLLARRVR